MGQSSSLSRSNLVKLSRQCYSPAPSGMSFDVLYGNGKRSPYSPCTVGSLSNKQPQVSPVKVTVKQDHSAF